jgi:hypothetical protein
MQGIVVKKAKYSVKQYFLTANDCLNLPDSRLNIFVTLNFKHACCYTKSKGGFGGN